MQVVDFGEERDLLLIVVPRYPVAAGERWKVVPELGGARAETGHDFIRIIGFGLI